MELLLACPLLGLEMTKVDFEDVLFLKEHFYWLSKGDPSLLIEFDIISIVSLLKWSTSMPAIFFLCLNLVKLMIHARRRRCLTWWSHWTGPISCRYVSTCRLHMLRLWEDSLSLQELHHCSCNRRNLGFAVFKRSDPDCSQSDWIIVVSLGSVILKPTWIICTVGVIWAPSTFVFPNWGGHLLFGLRLWAFTSQRHSVYLDVILVIGYHHLNTQLLSAWLLLLFLSWLRMCY